jgi:hypothetical protein
LNRTDPAALARRLIVAANELLAAAYELGARAGAERGDPGAGAPPAPEGHDDPLWLVVARQAYRDRRRREEIFGDELFGEPAWDILLDLFIAEREGKRISITSACIGAAAPSTTALRWLNILEREGLIAREGDSNDMRRSYVRLTAEAHDKMIDYLGEGSGAAADNDTIRAKPGATAGQLDGRDGRSRRVAYPD